MSIDIRLLNREIDRLDSGADITTAQPLTVNRAQATVREEYLAVQFFIAADLRRYGKLIEDIENAFTAGNVNAYPRTVNKSYKMLVNNKNDPCNHRYAVTESESISFITQVKGKNESENKEVTCYKCQEKGHYHNTCPNKYVPPPWKEDNGKSNTAPYKVKSTHNKVTVVDEENEKSSG